MNRRSAQFVYEEHSITYAWLKIAMFHIEVEERHCQSQTHTTSAFIQMASQRCSLWPLTIHLTSLDTISCHVVIGSLRLTNLANMFACIFRPVFFHR